MISNVSAFAQTARARPRRPMIEADDGTRLFHRDWGEGAPVVFCHPCALNADIWEYQISELIRRGLRCVAFDRRGHGRSDDPGFGYDFETLADDLAAVMDTLDLRDATLVGWSMGSAEVVHYLSRHGADRVARVMLASPIGPTPGDPMMTEVYLAGVAEDRPGFMSRGLPLFTGRRDMVSEAMSRWVLDQLLLSSPYAIAECQRTIATTDFCARLKSVSVPTLIIQGDEDEVCFLEDTGSRLAKAIPGAKLRVYEGAPHGVALTHRARFNEDLLRFVLSDQSAESRG